MNIETRNVIKSFGSPAVQILKGISVSIPSGDYVALTGRSGSGKSTLMYILSSLDTPTSGEVLIGGKNVAAMESHEVHRLRNLSMGFVFQFHYLLPELSALENVLIPAMKSGQVEARRKLALSLMEELELGSRLHHFPSQLSGGEQQRVAIARSLVMEPKILFADEPTGNLDTVSGDRVMRTLKEVNRKGTTVVIVTHDPDYARQANRQIRLVDGAVAAGTDP
jgi:putative ABC transport system ATP-binding protein/lipoprotein-releasing system ATP-binding protein